MKNIFTLCIFCFGCFISLNAFSQLTATNIQPASSNSFLGSITVQGLTAGTTYIVSYKRDGAVVNLGSQPAATSEFPIPNLTEGVYSDITFQNGTTINKVPGTNILGRVAVQDIKFTGAAYINFTGVPDDDPENFTQVYAMLSQPLRKIYGINTNAHSWKRCVLLRNLFFQITYGNTDKFKLYSYDTLGTKYVNKLDLVAHAYIKAEMSLNLLTFIIPQTQRPASGDLCHFYINGDIGFISTNVTEVLSKDSSLTKSSALHSILIGIDAAAKFTNVFDSKFQIQLGLKAFSVHSATGIFDPSMNPQSGNISYLSNAQNVSRNFERSGNPLFYNIDARISYKFTKDPEENASNLFLNYSSTTDLAKASGKNYSNSYFQFQTGIDLDIAKLFGSN